jgi:hypothetical protein
VIDAGAQASTRKRDILDFSGFAFPAASQVLHSDAPLPLTSCGGRSRVYFSYLLYLLLWHTHLRLHPPGSGKHTGNELLHTQEAELQKVAAKLGRMTATALNQLLDIFELPRGTGEEGHKVLQCAQPQCVCLWHSVHVCIAFLVQRYASTGIS